MQEHNNAVLAAVEVLHNDEDYSTDGLEFEATDSVCSTHCGARSIRALAGTSRMLAVLWFVDIQSNCGESQRFSSSHKRDAEETCLGKGFC